MIEVQSNSIAAEFLGTDIVVVHPGIREHRTHRSNKARRSGNVVNRRWEPSQMFLNQFPTDLSSNPIPPPSGLRHLCHATNQFEVWILLFKRLQLRKKRCILWSTVGIEQKDTMRQFLLCCV